MKHDLEEQLKNFEEQASTKDESKQDFSGVSTQPDIFSCVFSQRTNPGLANRALLWSPWLHNLYGLRLAHLLLLCLGKAHVRLALLWCLCLFIPLANLIR